MKDLCPGPQWHTPSAVPVWGLCRSIVGHSQTEKGDLEAQLVSCCQSSARSSRKAEEPQGCGNEEDLHHQKDT